MPGQNHLFIAVDLGAESGRVVIGRLGDGRLSFQEVHRFATGAHSQGGFLRWDLAGIQSGIEEGLTLAAHHQQPGESASVSVDSWGVDYVLMRDGQPLSLWPFHYRDARTLEVFERVKNRFGSEIFAATGLQFLPFNTLYQLLAEREQNPQEWQRCDGFLLIADYFTGVLSGVARSESSLASTTQLFDPLRKNWSNELLDHFDLPAHKFAPVVPSGTVLGPLAPAMGALTGLHDALVVATCAHDTGAAVAAVPARSGDDWAFLSSGTWSLLGLELPAPLINEEVLRAGFTNEAGYGGTTRFLKNIVGLWIVQECRRFWAAEGQPFSYAQLSQMAGEAAPLCALIRPDDARFAHPGEMPAKIADFCRQTGQAPPQTPGECVRCVLESLALSYRQTLELAETLTGRSVSTLHLVGGGSQNELLNGLAADATGRTVVAGPVEATALGNLGVQAIALGHLDSLDALRETVGQSFAPRVFSPHNSAAWQAAALRFQNLQIQ